jgi:hypothetical protein
MMKQQTPSTTKKLKELTSINKNKNGTQEEYTNYFKNIKRVGKETMTKTIIPPIDWFETSKDKLQPQINTVNSIRKQLHECKDKHTKSCLERDLRLDNKIHNIVVAEAKELYMSKLAEKNSRLAGTNSKAAWKAVHKCKLGNKINHKKKQWGSDYPMAKKQKKQREHEHEHLPPPLHQDLQQSQNHVTRSPRNHQKKRNFC